MREWIITTLAIGQANDNDLKSSSHDSENDSKMDMWHMKPNIN